MIEYLNMFCSCIKIRSLILICLNEEMLALYLEMKLLLFIVESANIYIRLYS